ncbi:MAG: prephenate dehydratase [Bacteroidia bacterium]|nr:prephenate dehydratase [Bacteroidia bacterium]
MKIIKIGIQGARGAFHEIAACKYYENNNASILRQAHFDKLNASQYSASLVSTGSTHRSTGIEIVECKTFQILCEVLKHGKADYCLMAIENTIVGSILTNYTVLEDYKFKITGEQYLRIEHHLMALPGQKIEDIKYIQSHPMAILQCSEFLYKYPDIKILNVDDTAESAREISEKNLYGYAAIASDLAAEIYGLEIIARNIETHKRNYTRFLIIAGRDTESPPNPDKASIQFQLEHKPGSLLGMLEIFKKYNLNMTKLQSVPILGKPYEYSFHVDLEWDNYDSYKEAKIEIINKAIGLTLFGEYKRGNKNLW